MYKKAPENLGVTALGYSQGGATLTILDLLL